MVVFFKVYFYLCLCMCAKSAGDDRGQKSLSHALELKLQVVVSHTGYGCWVPNSYPLEEPESCLRLSPLYSPTRRGCNGGRHSNKINNSTALFQ